jgi:hypothetical protein
VLYVCAALMAAFSALRRPPLDALIPQLVERDELKAAAAIGFIGYNGGSIAGPAAAGVLIAGAGVGVTYMNAMFFGVPPALFPAILERYGGPKVLGLMYAAPAVGSALAALASGWNRHVHRHGRAVTLAAVAWGVAIAEFGLIVPARALLALAIASRASGATTLARRRRGRRRPRTGSLPRPRHDPKRRPVRSVRCRMTPEGARPM